MLETEVETKVSEPMESILGGKSTPQGLAAALEGRISFVEFLQATPPGSSAFVAAFVYRQQGSSQAGISLPVIRVQCATCAGPRSFKPERNRTNHELDTMGGATTLETLAYTCRDCEKEKKLFALSVTIGPKAPPTATGATLEGVKMLKIGEVPTFGIKPPDELSRFLESDAELFQKGLLAENQGLGVGAYAYYRRIVENQMGHLLDLIDKVIAAEGGGSEDIKAAIIRARATDRFTRALEQIKDMLPRSLRIDGHNPLQLLFDQISDDVHSSSDDECLARAAVIRHVLGGMASRVAALVSEDRALRDSISALMKIRNQQPRTTETGRQLAESKPHKTDG
jgi:hypothetical protein